MIRDMDRDPIYNLKAVVGETGISAHALRAWERRHGLPHPARTEAGHRVYSRRDIDTIRWLVARQEEGLRIGQAVRLWHSLEAEGSDPLAGTSSLSEERTMPRGEQIVSLRREWVAACLCFDESGAERALTRALALYAPESVVSLVIREGIVQIGQGWYEGSVTPQQEHFASGLALRRLESLIWATPAPTRRGRILISSPAHEVHTLGPMILELLLRRAGWQVTHLGGDVPLEGLTSTMASTRPQLVILGAQRLHTAAELLDASKAIQQDGCSVGFGGGIFNRLPRLRERIPGHFLGSTLEEAVSEADNLMLLARRTPDVQARAEVYDRALSSYADQLLPLQMSVFTDLQPTEAEHTVLGEINSEFVQAVVGALKLGEIGLAEDYLDWLDGKPDRQGETRNLLRRYLEAYRRAVNRHMGADGRLLTDWLSGRREANQNAQALAKPSLAFEPKPHDGDQVPLPDPP